MKQKKHPGTAGHGMAWHGLARHGRARQGKGSKDEVLRSSSEKTTHLHSLDDGLRGAMAKLEDAFVPKRIADALQTNK